jgi:hypothetical protein
MAMLNSYVNVYQRVIDTCWLAHDNAAPTTWLLQRILEACQKQPEERCIIVHFTISEGDVDSLQTLLN